jgi:DNA-binding IclR family transcriptional regulator
MTELSTEATSPRGGVQLIARIADILRALERAPEGLGLTELSGQTGLAKSTAHRLVSALVAEDFVINGPDGRLRLGRGIAQIGAAARSSLRQDLRPILIRLAAELDETADLSVLDGSAARFIDQVPSKQRLRAVSAIGVTFPLHSTANGKALLAALPPEQAAAILPARLSADTRHTITSRRKLWAELDRIRSADGIAYDRQEHTNGICAVGGVVRDAYGIAGAISIPVPATRFTEIEKQLVEHLRLAIADATAALGG